MLGGARSPNPDRSSDANQRRIARPYYRPAASPATRTHSAVHRENGKRKPLHQGPHVMLTERDSRGERSGCCHPLPRCMHLPLPFLLPPHAINRSCRAAPPRCVKHLTCTPTGGGVPILSSPPTLPMRPLRRIHLLLLLLLLLVSSLRFAAFQVAAQIFPSLV